MANMLQSSQQTSTAAPQFYSDYLSNLASSGTAAQKAAQFAGPTALQNQAFQNVGAASTAYQPTLNEAGQTLTQAATATSPLAAGAGYLGQAAQSPADLASQYMSPYLSSVVNAIGDVGQRNIQQNLAPLATAGAVGSGQFGSQRGAQVLGQTLSNADRDILNQQYQALNAGYNTALQTGEQQNQLLGTLGATAGNQASAGQQNLTQAGNALGTLAGTSQNLGLSGINALSTLGAQQQQIEQNKQNYPLTTLSTLASLMSGQQIPTTTTTTLNTSPLAGLAALGASGAGLTQLGGGLSNVLSNAGSALTNLFSKNASGTTPEQNDAVVAAEAQGYTLDPNSGYLTKDGQNYAFDANNNPVLVGDIAPAQTDQTPAFLPEAASGE
jgi:hypothetical protein